MQALSRERSSILGNCSTVIKCRTVKRIESRDFLHKEFLSDTKHISLAQHSAAKDSGSNQTYRQVVPSGNKVTTFTRELDSQYTAIQPEQSVSNLPASALLKQLPHNYYDVTPHDMIRLVSDLVGELVGRHAVSRKVGSCRLSRFHSLSVPPISVFNFLQRLQMYIRLSSPGILAITLYLKRLCHAPTSICLSHFTIHRLLLSCAAISAKVMSDYLCSNKLHARAGGVRPRELTLLEIDLLQALSWDVTATHEDLVECYLDLVSRNRRYILLAPPA